MTEDFNPSLAALLERHACADAVEAEHRDLILDFVLRHERPFDRAHLHGHLTASAFIADAAGERTLLGCHRKLGRWLQLGGHGEADEIDPAAVALREALEESGIAGLELHATAPRPLDVDVHRIPERKGVPGHDHLDIRFLVVAPAGAEPELRPDEHLQMQWFLWEDALELPMDKNMRRGLMKAWDICTAVARV